jgi:hypothetical protein
MLEPERYGPVTKIGDGVCGEPAFAAAALDPEICSAGLLSRITSL